MQRTYRGVELTEEAKQIARLSEDVFAKLEEIEAFIDQKKNIPVNNEIDNKVTVYMSRGWNQGAIGSIMSYMIDDLGLDPTFPDICSLNERYLKFVNDNKDCILFNFFTEPIDNLFEEFPEVENIKIKTSQPFLICSNNYPLVAKNRKDITPAEVCALPLLRFTEGYDQAMAIFEILEEYGKVNIVANFSHINMLIAMLKNNKEVSLGTNIELISNRETYELLVDQMRFIPILTRMRLTLTFCYNRHISPIKLVKLKRMVREIVSL